jgi:hypothetical protein
VIANLRLAKTDAGRGFTRGAKYDVVPVPGPVDLLQRVHDAPLADRIGEAGHRLVEQGVGRAFEWSAWVEDGPNPDDRVTLDAALTNGDGVSAPKLTYRISEQTDSR